MYFAPAGAAACRLPSASESHESIRTVCERTPLTFSPIKCVVLCVAVIAIRVMPCALAQPLATDPALVTGELDNGFRYAIRSSDDPAYAWSILLQIKAGSLHETDAQRGAARIAGGLAARGTSTINTAQLAELLEQFGLSAATDIKTSVSFGRTIVRLDVPHADPPPDVRPILDYLASLIDPGAGPVVSDDNVKRQARLIVDADAASSNTSTRLSARALPVLIPESRIAQRPSRDVPDIESTPADEVSAFIRRHFLPTNATLIIAGAPDPVAFEKEIEIIFSPLPAALAVEAPDPRIPIPKGPVVAIEHDPGLIKDIVQLVSFTPAVAAITTTEDARDKLVDRLAFAAMTDRIAELAQNAEIPVRAGAAFSIDEADTLRASSIVLMGPEASWPRLTDRAIVELRRAIKHGFDEQLIAATKARLLASLQRAAAEADSNATVLADRLADQFARGDTPMSIAQEAALASQIMPGITNDQLADAIRDRLDPARCGYLVVTANPEAKDDTRLGKRMRKALAKNPSRARSEPMLDHLLPIPQTPGRVTRLTSDAEAGVFTAHYQGGLRLHVRHLDAAPGRVAVSLAVSGGRIDEDQLSKGLTQAMSTVWFRPAVAGRSTVQTHRLLSAHGVTVRGVIADDAVCIVAEAPVEHLDTMLELMRGIIDDPAPDPRAFREYRTLSAAGVAIRDIHPLGALDRLCTQALFPPGDVRHAPLHSQEISALKSKRVATWARRVMAKGAIDLAIVGDIDRAVAIERTAAIIGSVKRTIRPAPDQAARHLKLPKGPISVEAHQHLTIAQAAVAVGFRGPDRAAFRDVILAELTAIVLTERFTRRIRDQQRMTPKIGVESRPAEAYIGTGRFEVVAVSAQHNAGQLAEKIRNELDNAARSGPTHAELRAAKLRLSGLWRARLDDPAIWARELALARLRDEPLEALTGALSLIGKSRAVDIRDFLSRFDRPAQRFTAIVLPKPDRAAE